MTRYGSANPSPIGPTGKTRQVDPRPSKGKSTQVRPLSIVRRGTGPYVSEILYDESAQRMIVVHTGSDRSSTEGTRMGDTVADIEPFDDPNVIAAPALWYPEAAANSPLLPETFTHATGFDSSTPPLSNLPNGYGYVRLIRGSMPVDDSRWDADSATHGSTDAPPDDVVPELVYVTVDAIGDDSNNATVSLWFSHAVALAAATYSRVRLKQSFKITGGAGSRTHIDSVAMGAQANRVVLTLDRSLTIEETIRVSIAEGAVIYGSRRSKVRTSPVLEAVHALPKYAYVLVANFSSETIPEGTKVILTSAMRVFDGDNKASHTVWSVSPAGGGGGGPAPKTYFPATLVGDTLLGSEDHFFTPEAPADWNDYLLPLSFEHPEFEDLFKPESFPGLDDTPLPEGIGLARLRLPSDIKDGRLGSAVDPSVTYGSATAYPGSGGASISQIQVRPNNKIWLWCSHNISVVDLGATAWGLNHDDFFTITHNADPLIVFSVSAAVVGEHTNVVEITVTGVSEAQWEEVFSAGPVTVSLDIYPAVGLDPARVLVGTDSVPSVPITGTQAATYALDRAAYLFVMNRVTHMELAPGDSLSLAPDSFLTLTDENSVSVRVYDILPMRSLPSAPPAILSGAVIGGNTLDSGQPGIKHSSSPASLGGLVDPYANPTLPNGYGYVYGYSDGAPMVEIIGGNPVHKRVIVRNSTVGQAVVIGEWLRIFNMETDGFGNTIYILGV